MLAKPLVKIFQAKPMPELANPCAPQASSPFVIQN
jgi:hypothetical protein